MNYFYLLSVKDKKKIAFRYQYRKFPFRKNYITFSGDIYPIMVIIVHEFTKI